MSGPLPRLWKISLDLLAGKYKYKFLIDAQGVSGIDGHYEAEYDLKSGGSLKFQCKQARKDMIFRVSLGKGATSYSVEIDKYVSDDLMPVSIFMIRELVDQWLRA